MKELGSTYRVLGYAFLVLACVLTLVPFLYIVVNSLKYDIDIARGTLFFEPTLAHFEKLLFGRDSRFVTNLQNSVIVAVASTAAALAVATLAAYALARFRWTPWIVGGIVAWLVAFSNIPNITIAGPWYVMFRSLGLYDTLVGLILAHTTLNLPLATLLLIGFIRAIPTELEDAAYIDGCTRFGAFWRVVLPIVMPGVSTAGILAFLNSWNEFAVAVNITSSLRATLPVAIANNSQQWTIRYAEMATGAVIATLPAIILIVLGQRFIIKGLTLGAIK